MLCTHCQVSYWGTLDSTVVSHQLVWIKGKKCLWVHVQSTASGMGFVGLKTEHFTMKEQKCKIWVCDVTLHLWPQACRISCLYIGYIYNISLLMPEMVGLVELLPCNAVEPENNGNKELASELAVFSVWCRELCLKWESPNRHISTQSLIKNQHLSLVQMLEMLISTSK